MQKINTRVQITLLTCVCLVLYACDTTTKPEKTSLISPAGIFSAALSEQYALLGTVRGDAELWQLKPKVLRHTWQHTDAKNGIISAAISANEQYAVTAEKDSIAWWDVNDGTLLNVWSLPGIHSISLSADGEFALIGLESKAIYFALKYGKTIFAFSHQKPVITTALSDSGQFAITGSKDQTAKLWRLSTGELKTSWKHNSSLSAVAISHDDTYALTNAALGPTRLWKIDDGEFFQQLGPNLMTVSSVMFSKDNKHLLTGRTSQRIDLWKIKRGKLVKYWRPKKDDYWRPSAATILALTFTQNNKKVYSIASNGYLQRWRK